MTLIPAIFAAIAVPLIYFYPLGDKELKDIQRDLVTREDITQQNPSKKVNTKACETGAAGVLNV
jgi:GPH family glycoside/pentoside/hexuronide:cation symporter